MCVLPIKAPKFLISSFRIMSSIVEQVRFFLLLFSTVELLRYFSYLFDWRTFSIDKQTKKCTIQIYDDKQVDIMQNR